jgi:hypothetical protein
VGEGTGGVTTTEWVVLAVFVVVDIAGAVWLLYSREHRPPDAS